MVFATFFPNTLVGYFSGNDAILYVWNNYSARKQDIFNTLTGYNLFGLRKFFQQTNFGE